MSPDQAASLVATILSNMDPTDSRQRSAADRILTDLIESDMANAFEAPDVFTKWVAGEGELVYDDLLDSEPIEDEEEDDDEDDQDEG